MVVCCALVLVVRLRADGLRSVPLYRFGIASDGIGYANLALADIDGDARPEIISCSLGSPLALGYSGGTYVPVWHGADVSCTAAAAGDADGDGATDVIVVNGTSTSPGGSWNGGQVMVFDPRGFGAPRLTVSLPGLEPATGVAFGNVDFDAAPEIVVTTVHATHVFDARTLQLQWSATGYGGTELALGDIDGDARLEIVINREALGSVLDGGNELVKWSYAGGFGENMSVGNADADPKAEIVFPYAAQYAYSDIVILNGDFTSSKIPFNGMPKGVADANGDGVNEVITEGQFGEMKGLRPSDGAVLWTNPSPESGVFGAVAVGDVDGDGKPELVYGAGTSTYRDILIVADVVSHTIEHESLDLDGNLHSATADVDRDGRADLVIASSGSDSTYHGGIVQIVDPRTHAVKGALSRTGLTYFEIDRIAVGQLDGDPALEIVALGTLNYNPMLVVWDGVTRQIEWQYPPPGSGLESPGFNNADLAVANVDGDAVDEIVLAMTDGNLIVLNGASPVIQASKPLDGDLVSIELADIDHDGTLEAVVATNTTLYLLDTADWSVIKAIPFPFIRRVAATGDAGGRIAVTFEGESYTTMVRLYDPSLTASWTCALSDGYDYYYPAPVEFVDAGGETRLVAGTRTGGLRIFPIAAGTDCPASSTIPYSTRPLFDIHAVDVTGDGWPELVADGWNAVEVEAIGLPDELRGDADGDGSIGAQDVDALADTLFGATPGVLPMADVNADQRISPEDVFALIDYEYAGGPEPQP
jgi:hypothetical protein